jgi:hypothetical protein
MTAQHRVTAKLFAIAAVALGPWLGSTAPAGADPDAMDPGPNPFGVLRCGCHETAPPDEAARRREIEQGIQEGLSAWLPGLPPPTRRGS